MTREEAFEQLKAGKKVTHEYFTSDEYLEYVGCQIMTEDGYHFDVFWSQSKDREWMKDGWSIKQ